MRKIILFLIAILICTGLFLYLGENPKTNQASSILENQQNNVSIINEGTESDNSTKLDDQIISEVENTEGTYIFKVKQLEKIKYPRRLDEAYDQLKSAADNGNLRAAHVLSETLRRCQTLPRTQEERSEYLKRGAESMIYQDQEEVSKMCLNISEEQVSETLHYAQLAASENNVGALLNLAFTFDPQLQDKSPEEIQADPELSNLMHENNMIRLDALERAANNGSMSSLATLGLEHHKNRYSVENNMLHARKYYQAYYLMTGSEGINRKIGETERYLSHDEIIESNLMAENLIQNWEKINNIYK